MALPNYTLNRLLGIQQTNFEIVDVQDRPHEIVFKIKHREQAIYICPRCNGEVESAHAHRWITLYDMPWGSKRVKWLVYRAQILCPCSYNLIVEKLPFRSKHHQLTQRFVDYIEQVLCTKMFTVMDVARLFNLDYGTVYKIDHDVLYRLIQYMEIPDPINIAVDEKSFRKGHKYVTIVTDTDLGKVIWVSQGHTKESLDEFFKALGPERCAKIETVSKDGYRPFAESCDEYIPNAIQVADPFHVVQNLSKTIDSCRKELLKSRGLHKKTKEKIKGTLWLIRHKQENMSDSMVAKLPELKKINEKLYEAYLHKEVFFELFTYKPSEAEEAKSFIEEWCRDACKIGFEAMTEFSEYLKRNIGTILNIITEQRSSAMSEGINRKVNVIKSMAYGYRNIRYFMLKVMQRCGVLGSLWRPAHQMPDYTTNINTFGAYFH